jgi:putative DNA primase/helicase
LGKHSDAGAILERLKSITGGDPQNIDDKFTKEATNVIIKARFTIAMNELPRIPDASSALIPRMLAFQFMKSFEGREDRGLQARLMEEAEGITNWALSGLRTLRDVGHFVQPKAGADVLSDFDRLSSPVRAFLDECCDFDESGSVPCQTLRNRWESWCVENGHEPGSASSFGSKLMAAGRSIKKGRRGREGGKQVLHYQGLKLVAPPEGSTCAA